MNSRKRRMKKSPFKILVASSEAKRELRPRKPTPSEPSNDDEQGNLVIDFNPPSTDLNIQPANDQSCQEIQVKPIDLSTNPHRSSLNLVNSEDTLVPLDIPIHHNEYVNGERKSRHRRLRIRISKSIFKELAGAFNGTAIVGPIGPCNFYIRCSPDLILNSKPTAGKPCLDTVSCKSPSHPQTPFPHTAVHANQIFLKPLIFVREDKNTGMGVGAVDFGLDLAQGSKMFVVYFIEGHTPQDAWMYLDRGGTAVTGRMVYFNTAKLMKKKPYHFIVFSVVGGFRTPFSDCFCITP